MMRTSAPVPESYAPSRTDVDDLVGQLVSAGVELSLDEPDIVFTGPAEALAPETIAALRANKQALVTLFRNNLTRGVIALQPTTREQRRMEWRHRVDRKASTYNVCLRLDLAGAIDRTALESTTIALVQRHEILRSRFAWYGAHLLQEVTAPPRSVLQMLDASVLAYASDEDIADWCATCGAAPFHLAAEAPARWCYAPTGPQRGILLVTLHHIACDGWSLDRLLHEFQRLCRAVPAGDVRVLPPVGITPGAFARWESAWLTGDRLHQARDFWADELRGTAWSPTFTQMNRPVSAGGHASCVTRRLGLESAAAVGAAARALNLSEFPLYFAAFAMLLHHETGAQDFAVVIAVANRTRPEQDDLIGLTRNAQPIRCTVRTGDTIDIVARRISTRVDNALAYQWYPIGLIPLDDAGVDVRRLPLTFGLAGTSDQVLDCGRFSTTVRDVFLGGARAGFSLLIRRHADRVEAFFEYARAELPASEAARLADCYVQIVNTAFDRWRTP